jgi:hypothetical protein
LIRFTFFLSLCVAWIVTLGAGAAAEPETPIGIHPDNSHYFLFRGKPLALITATEHYGSVFNRPFDFERYLDDAAKHRMTLTRTFLLFRELQSARNPSSPCKPESPDYIAPFVRTGPEKAMDGEAVYDLDRWNPEYFERLHRFLEAASRRGIIVELTIFSNTYAENIWALNPFRAENNRQKIGRVEWQDYLSLREPELVRRQAEYARKIIQETAQFDNVYYEICNEPGGGMPGHATLPDIDAWQAKMAGVVTEEMNRLHRPHLIAGQQAFTYSPKFRFPLDQTYGSGIFQIVNVHPLPDTDLRGKLYQLGHFMSKELMLADVAAFCQKAAEEQKPTVLDEDNAASMYRDITGWTIHRKRAWTALLNGSHYDYIDFSITVGSETGTPASQAGIRKWMQHLSEFMAGFDYIHAKPARDWVTGAPEHTVASALAVAGRDYAVYLGDSREVTEPGAGSSLRGNITLLLPRGRFSVRLYSPAAGEYSPGVLVDGGKPVSLDLPEFRDDLVVRAEAVRVSRR